GSLPNPSNTMPVQRTAAHCCYEGLTQISEERSHAKHRRAAHPILGTEYTVLIRAAPFRLWLLTGGNAPLRLRECPVTRVFPREVTRDEHIPPSWPRRSRPQNRRGRRTDRDGIAPHDRLCQRRRDSPGAQRIDLRHA